MNVNRNAEEVKLDLQVSPLIDVVFLLLIYFLVTAALIKKEGDISFMLPAKAEETTLINLPVEVVILIAADGTVEVNGITYPPKDLPLLGLSTLIKTQQAMALSQRSVFFVNLLPSQDTLHSRVVDVMDACAAAGVKNLSFSKAL